MINTFLDGNFCGVNQPDGLGYPPLFYAAMSISFSSAIQVLKERGADFNYVVPDPFMPPNTTGDRRLIPLLILQQRWTEAARLLELGPRARLRDDPDTLLQLCKDARRLPLLYAPYPRDNGWNQLVGVLVDLQCKTFKPPLYPRYPLAPAVPRYM